MVTPNLDTITASLERSLQNCSLNHQHSSSSSAASGGGVARTPESPPQDSTTPTLELNSEASLPFHWEQCLDLKTGEIYYINWRTGMRVTEDPRTAAEYGGGYYSEEEDSSSYNSDGSSAESSPSSSREQWSGKNNNLENCYCEENIENNSNSNSNLNSNNNVLVVAGCKSCLMYYMVPKHLEICPKCCGQLLHFDRSENASS